MVDDSRHDGWVNPLLGFGTPRDKATGASMERTRPLDEETLRALYNEDPCAAKIVDELPETALRLGWKTTPDVELDEYLCLEERFKELHIWGRLHGGAILIVGLDDGRDPSLPLGKAKSIQYLTVIDRWSAQIHSRYMNPLAPRYGEPEVYRVTGLDGSVALVHESRTLLVKGANTDEKTKRLNQGWNLSILQKPYEYLRAFGGTFQAVSALLTDMAQAVFKISGLKKAIAADGGGGTGTPVDPMQRGMSALNKRLEWMDMARSAMRAVVLDAGDGTLPPEEFTRVATPLAGVPDLIDRVMQWIAMVAGMPLTVLMGMSPGGLNATGDSDLRLWYDRAEVYREKRCEPLLKRLYSMIGKEVEIEWPPVWSPSAAEKADIQLKQAQTDSIYLTAQVLMPEEVAIERFSEDSGWEIDLEVRQGALDDGTAFETEAPLQAGIDPSLQGTPGSGDPLRAGAPGDRPDVASGDPEASKGPVGGKQD